MANYPEAWQALAVDIAAGRVHEVGGRAMLTLPDGDETADVTNAAWELYFRSLADVGPDGRTWVLSVEGHAAFPEAVADA